MKYLKLKTGDVINATYLRYEGSEEKDWGGGPKTTHKHVVDVNGEEYTYTASAYLHEQDLAHLEAGQKVVVTKTFSNGKNFVNFSPAGDAVAQAAIKQAPQNTDFDKREKDKDEKITMGMCMNCASRIIGAHAHPDWEDFEYAKQIVKLAKAIYAEYTKEETIETEPSPDELPKEDGLPTEEMPTDLPWE